MARKSGEPLDERQFVRRVLIVLALTALFYLAWQLRTLLLMLFGAVVIAAIFRSVAERICKLTRLPIGPSVIVSILLVFAMIGLLVALFGAQVGDQVRTLEQTLPKAWQALEARVGSMGLGERLQQIVGGAGQGGGGGSLTGLGRMIMSVGTGLADTLVVIFGGIFLAIQPKFYRTGVIKLVPEGKRPIIAEAMTDSERALRLWLKGQLIAMVVVGVLTGTGLWLLGVPSALTLGLLAGLLEFIPFAGPVIAAIPAVLLALATGPDAALWVVLLYIIVQQFEGVLLQPMVQQYAVDLPGVILLFSLIGCGMIFGILGVILAAPLTVVTYVLVKRLYVQQTLGTATPIPGEDKA